ncbi:MAG: ABC-F family ATP-binding cassette domain-containing protein [Ardenticatenaceae bacterium]|nr:ABC-F family ATP-binding cassette domain-containing protein [Ardenticatenaceae bacterium]
MAILTATNVGQSFGPVDLFSGINVSIPNDGKVGLVGPNGVGKTTLLRILAGVSLGSSGAVAMSRNTQIGYLSQEAAQTFAGRDHSVYEEMLVVFADLRADEARLRQLEVEMETADHLPDDLFTQYSQLQVQFELAGGYEYDLRIRQVLTGLGFPTEDWQMPLTHLSGGQRTRARLARLLLEAPDLLILDEPTNHLDVEAIEWLEGILQKWPGAVLMVSHDRYFLDKVVNTIWEMNGQGLEVYRGNYSAHLQQREARWELRQKEFETLMERLEKEMDFIRRNIAGQRTQMAQGKLSRLTREVEAIHKGGLQVVAKLNKGWAELKSEIGLDSVPSLRVGELQQRIGELRGPSRPPSLSLTLRPSHRSGEIVLRTKGLQVGYPGAPLFAADDIELHRRECAALIGPNGAGKSTFLRTILDQLPVLAGEVKLGASLKIGYFSQAHEELHREKQVLDVLLDYENLPISEARNYLARFLFRGDDVYKQVSMLSGGERGRLALALLEREEANFLLLDEPTNHLDIPAQEELQTVLEGFDGTILMVSHDRYLVNRLATQVWVLENGRLHVYPTSYQEYLVEREREREAAKPMAVTEPAETKPEANGRSALSKNEQRRKEEALADLEATITQAEADIARITQELQAATQEESFDKIQSLSIEYAAAEEALDALMMKWEKLAHE